MNIVYLNGSFMPIDEARIPVLDRGFLFGDAVYEVVPVYDRHPFRLDWHLQRLQNSLDGIRLKNPMSTDAWKSLFLAMIEKHTQKNQSIYLQVTRGVAKRDQAFPMSTPPTLFMMSNPLHTPSPEDIENGVSAITSEDFRWLKCDIKSTSLLGNCLLRQLSAEQGATETILFREGQLTEASTSNVFIVKNNVLLAPVSNHLLLPGITYQVILEIAREREFELEVRDISAAETLSADEIWLTSSSKEVLAVTRLNGQPVGEGKPGRVFKRMHALFQALKREGQ